ncbi:nuclear transport factor 2 family protein [Phenylobacterium sp.]|uniref:nuclear transport factor 2 family protein n=1 Tax=Phenylobacterium sp. TaxID=1871053 RepID=UPI0035AD76E5
MQQSPEEIIDAQVRAYERGDLEAFLDFYEPDCVCTELPAGRVLAAGHGQIADVWGKVFAGGPRQVAIPSRIVEGRFVTDLEEVLVVRTGRRLRGVTIYHTGPRRIRAVWFLVAPGQLADADEAY